MLRAQLAFPFLDSLGTVSSTFTLGRLTSVTQAPIAVPWANLTLITSFQVTLCCVKLAVKTNLPRDGATSSFLS